MKRRICRLIICLFGPAVLGGFGFLIYDIIPILGVDGGLDVSFIWFPVYVLIAFQFVGLASIVYFLIMEWWFIVSDENSEIKTVLVSTACGFAIGGTMGSILELHYGVIPFICIGILVGIVLGLLLERNRQSGQNQSAHATG